MAFLFLLGPENSVRVTRSLPSLLNGEMYLNIQRVVVPLSYNKTGSGRAGRWMMDSRATSDRAGSESHLFRLIESRVMCIQYMCI